MHSDLEYVQPHVEDYGDLRELTAGQESGACTDADFPAGTPFDDLTFTNCA